MANYRMRVLKYIPNKLYGFCRDDNGFEVFFHLAVFRPGREVNVVRCMGCPGPPRCQLITDPPPPILGEEVCVTLSPTVESRGKAPRAQLVERVQSARMITGVVESYDPQRRYGFIRGQDDVSYHLHGSEVADGKIPLTSRQVVFFAGWREGRPRACHVRVCR